MDFQKRIAYKNGKAKVHSFVEGDLVLLPTVNLPRHVVTNVGGSKLLPKYIGPFSVLSRQGNAYMIELPRRTRNFSTLTWGVSGHTYSTSPLLTIKIAPKVTNFNPVLVFALKAISLDAY